MVDIAQIVEILKGQGHEWKRDGEYFTPTISDVEAVIDEGMRMLNEADAGNQYERGGIIIQKSIHKYDLYIYLGEV